MLAELRVRDLGVIADLSLVLGPGMTAVTGETGAGKTLVVEAIELLVGGRAESGLVRQGAAEARVDGRFDLGDDAGDEQQTVLARVLPAEGRSRAYVDGSMATVGALAETAGPLVDLHGQHAHQSLLTPASQRRALDAFAGVDLTALQAARAALKAIDDALGGLGGDERARAREVDLLLFQVGEIDAALLQDPDEDQHLAAEEDALRNAAAHREAAATAHSALAADEGAVEALGRAVAAVTGHAPLLDLEARLRASAAELQDVVAEVRAAAERLEDDPQRLEEIRARRQLLRDLTRKYGDTVAAVVSFGEEARARLDELQSREARASALEVERGAAVVRLEAEAEAVAVLRRDAADAMAAAVTGHLRTLAMATARVEISVEGAGPGDDVSFLLAANPGEPPQPLARVASGGELARAMLAVRLVLLATGDGATTLVFDEVDAGVGGEAALAVGRALAALAGRHQVLVVTHLAQVAAFADHHVVVTKREVDGRTVAAAAVVEGADRVVELSRMLSGRPESETARVHAQELLATARAALA
ncbi:MAG TPA: DNA repair protein RecN [Acidimicrobiales bacterium]|nr:DNA repair protein RecN [Acidimicrobiales bacterium]